MQYFSPLKTYPDFTFEITPAMINNPRNQRGGFAICHMVQQFYVEDVVTRTGASLKMDTFNKVVSKVKEVVFGV